ncbi:MAG: hypothetical protein ACK4SY_02045 [Pyrobaculum sp.]
MKINFIPRNFFLDRGDFNLFCILLKGIRQASFITGIPLSTLYRKAALFRRRGFDSPGIYLAIRSTDGVFQVLRRPVAIAGRHCVYLEEDCGVDCLQCPMYFTHLNALTRLQLVEGHYATPRDLIDAIIEKAKRRLGRGFAIEDFGEKVY